MTGSPAAADAAAAPLVDYALRLGDDALILAQRLGEWVTRAPELEEELALANIGLDLLGHARWLLSYAGEVEGAGRDEDALAYLREPHEFRNLCLVERPRGDFAATMARLLVFAAYQVPLYDRLRDSTDGTLAAVAAKALPEVSYHRDHATQWVLRLGEGTEVSHRRMQAGLERVWPYVAAMFEADDVVRGLAALGVAVDPAGLRPPWAAYVLPVLDEATLTVPPAGGGTGGDGRDGGDGGDGRHGRHTAALTALLAPMQALHRAHPGASW